jgi:hypothetical protein
MSRPRFLRRSAMLVVLWLSCVAAAFAGEGTAVELLPPSTVIFAEIPQPQELLNAVYDHKLVERLMELAQVRAAMEKKPYLDFKAGVAVVESQMGLPWRRIVGQAMGGGVCFAVDAKTQGVVILARGTDEAVHGKLLETLANLASLDAKGKGKADPVETADYRGVKVYAVDKNRFVILDDWLVITNKEELGKQVIDRFLERSQKSLASDAQFAEVQGAMSASTAAWAYVNAATLRSAGVAKELFGGQAENPLLELLFGGILNALQHTPYVAIGLNAGDQDVRLFAHAPYDNDWAKDLREYYFGPEGKGVAPPQLFVEDTIVSLSSYRDVSAMWLRAGDLFDEHMNEELAKADSGLTTLFGGKDFGEDILGALRPEIQLVVARQVFAEGQPAPAIQLPAFGIVAELKDPATMQPELRRTFQSLVGFLNIVGAMNGQPQLDLDLEKTDSALFVTSSYLPDANVKDTHSMKINYNFSPSIAFVDGRFIVASTIGLAHALATTSANARPMGDAQQVVNTDGVLRFDTLQEILAANRGQLVAQNMLKEGHTTEEAERDIGELLDLIGLFDHLGFAVDTTPDELRVSLTLTLRPTD